MYSPLKVKAVNVIGILSILIGILSIFSLIFYLPLFQTIIPANVSIMLGIASVWIILGSILLITQSQIKKYDIVLKSSDELLEKTVAESSSEKLALLEKLKNCDGNYQSLIEQSFDAVYVLDFKGNFIEVNSSMCKMTGYTRDELLKLNITNLIDPEQLKTDPVIPFRNNYKQDVIKERRLVHKDGKILDVETRIKKFADDRILVIADDITGRKQLEIELHKAELKFHTLAEQSAVGVYVLQKEKIVYLNPRFAEVFGYEPYELANTPTSFVDIIINDDYKAIVRKNLYARYSAEVDFVNYEVTGKKKDGTFNHVEFSGSRAVIDGEPTIIGTMIDITERWKAEEILRQYEADLQTIIDTADIAYALFDKNLKVTAFNEIAAKFSITQYKHILKTGDDLKDYFDDDRISQFKHTIDEVLAGGNISYEVSYPQPDGSANWYYIRLYPIMDSNKINFGLMLAISNITERKKAENNLHAAYERIQRHINSIKEMAWKQSHLIRSPLANLKGSVGLLQDDPSDSEVLKNILVELERLDRVIIELADDASNHDL
jgi:PAS domain S-box-containing protein